MAACCDLCDRQMVFGPHGSPTLLASSPACLTVRSWMEQYSRRHG